MFGGGSLISFIALSVSLCVKLVREELLNAKAQTVNLSGKHVPPPAASIAFL
jgi:hypothetical protein